MTIQVEEGKYYRDGYGAKIGPMKRFSDVDYRWSGYDHYTERNSTYTDEGYFDVNATHSQSNLVGEWIDEPASATSVFTDDDDVMVDALLGCDAQQKAEPATKRSVLEAAIQTVADRGVPYGGVEDNFNRIARLWNAHLFNRFDVNEGGMVEIAALDASDVAMMMALMKIARLEANPSHADSWIDVAGYAACGGEIGAKMAVDK